MEAGTCLKSINESIGKNGTNLLSFKQQHLAFQECVHNDMLAERAAAGAKRRGTEERRDRREIQRMQQFMEFPMKAIVPAVKKVPKKEE